MLKAENITKAYNHGNKVALQDFSIEVPKGSIYGLLGPNGAGKTTFIRIINQIIQPDSGTIFINGNRLNLNNIRDIGYMPEERGLYKNMSIGDQLLYFGELKGMSKNDALAEAKKWFERLNIDQWWKKKISELSKGMAQKIQFVTTVLHRPKLLILDEPFSGFDPINANLIKEQIIRLKEKGTTIILSTHRMESVEEMCEFVTLINNSKKVIDGKIFDVREKFKQNIFEIAISHYDEDKLDSYIKTYSFYNLKKENGIASFEITKIINQKQFLLELMEIGQIRTFNEKIPSMNEVFIQSVK